MSLTVCFVAFALMNGKTDVFMLPNCDPKLTGNMQCRVEAPGPMAQHYALCWDPKTMKIVYSGKAYRSMET